jgi:hypothetical protein
MGKIPVLLLTFKRPDTTRQVIEAIKFYQPQRMYIASDGPRLHKPEEQEKVNLTRQLILQSIKWPCEIQTLFQENNLGCRVAVSTAIDWFFENEEEGIILEDDCVPDPDFFGYVENCLDKYRNDDSIMSVSGHNFDFDQHIPFTISTDYILSRYHHCWGWATWKRAWHCYDRDMINWPKLKDSSWLLTIGDNNFYFKHYWNNIFERAYQKNIDSWAYRWLFSCWANNGLSILPSKSLIKNIGFGNDATHTITNQSIQDFFKPINFFGPFINLFLRSFQERKNVVENCPVDHLITEKWFKINRFFYIKRRLFELFSIYR